MSNLNYAARQAAPDASFALVLKEMFAATPLAMLIAAIKSAR